MPRRIAVVAVHGVADQAPDESARSIADLLASLDGSRDREPRYRVLAEEKVRIPVRPMWERRSDPSESEPPGEPAAPKRRSSAKEMVIEPVKGFAAGTWRFLIDPVLAAAGQMKRSSYLRKKRKSHERAPEHLDLEFMDYQLREYQSPGPSATYETIRISAMRDPDAAADEPTRVDIFEMYWADLSRAKRGVFRFFAELYQLFLHLSNLGAHLVDHEDFRRGGAGGWRAYSRLQATAVSFLTLVIPVLNLIMLGTLLVLPILGMPRGTIPWWLAAIAGITVAIAVDTFRARHAPSSRPVWVLLAFAAGGAVAWQALSYMQGDPGDGFGRYHALALAWFAIAGVAGGQLMRRYDRHNPGVFQVSYAIGTLWLLWLAMIVAAEVIPNTRAGLTHLALRLLEPFYIVNSLVWLLFLALAFTSCAVGWWVARRDPRDRESARRTAATARITLVIPAIGFLLLTLLIWIGLYHMMERFLPLEQLYAPILLVGDQPLPSLYRFMHDLLGASLTSGIALALGLIALAMFVSLWSLMPIAWAEVQPPRADNSPEDDDRRSLRMGKRLSQVYRAAAISGGLLLGALGAFFLGGTWDLLGSLIAQDALGLGRFSAQYASAGAALAQIGFHPRLADGLVVMLGTVLGLSAVSLFALRGKLDVLAVGLRPVLDIALDVDNYLRHHPVDRTPRARIAERYTSLLNYLFEPRHPGEPSQHYDAVVFVAHSQGTVITADLLRYIRSRDLLAANLSYDVVRLEGEPASPVQSQVAREWVPPTPLYLFTMGSPLRQLYWLRFPALYHWVGRAAGGSRSNIPVAAEPDPSTLGVQRWVNAYRSGDYVGRNLWLDDWTCRGVFQRVDRQDAGGLRRRRTDRNPTAHPDLQVAEDALHTRREACIGPGAHTHYWDDTAPDIAALLDDLIDEALQGGAVVRPGVTPPRNWSYVAPGLEPTVRR